MKRFMIAGLVTLLSGTLANAQTAHVPTLDSDNVWGGLNVFTQGSLQLDTAYPACPAGEYIDALDAALQPTCSAPFGGLAVVTHLIGGSLSPTVVVGSAAGGGSAAPVSGATDLSGYITVTTGSSPLASATLATVTFHTTYGAPPKVLLTPANAAAQGQSGLAAPSVYQANITTTGFPLTQGAAALQPNTTYVWSYFISQ
jgi:hypothetical protein